MTPNLDTDMLVVFERSEVGVGPQLVKDCRGGADTEATAFIAVDKREAFQ